VLAANKPSGMDVKLLHPKKQYEKSVAEDDGIGPSGSEDSFVQPQKAFLK